MSGLGDLQKAAKSLHEELDSNDVASYLLIMASNLANDICKITSEYVCIPREQLKDVIAKLEFLYYEQYYGDLKQSLTPTIREIVKKMQELLEAEKP